MIWQDTEIDLSMRDIDIGHLFSVEKNIYTHI